MIDLYNIDYTKLSWDKASVMQRLKQCQSEGYSVDEMGKLFFPVSRSRTYIYNLWKRLFNEPFVRCKVRKKCVVCGASLRPGANATTKMHARCRPAYFRREHQKEKVVSTEKYFQDLYKKVLTEGVSK